MGRLFALIAIIAAVWVIYHLWTKNNRLTDTEKLIWTVCAIAFSIVTAIVYYLTQYRKIQ